MAVAKHVTMYSLVVKSCKATCKTLTLHFMTTVPQLM